MYILYIIGVKTNRHYQEDLSSATSLISNKVLVDFYSFICRVEIKGKNHKTESTENFSSWKNEESAYEHIELRMEKVEFVRIPGMVKDKDIFAIEAPSTILEVFSHSICQL